MNSTIRLSAAQTQAAIARVQREQDGFCFWAEGHYSPTYATRAEAERASIQEWRDNLNPPAEVAE